MVTSKRYERFLLLARQFGLLLSKGQAQDEALRNIETALGKQNTAELTQLKQMLSEGDSTRLPRVGGPASTLRRVLNIAAQCGADKVKVFTAFYEKLLRQDEAKYISNFDVSNLLFYFIAVLVILAIVTGIYFIFVFPEVEQLFREAGSRLPALTRFVMTILDKMGIPLLILIMLISGFLFYLILTSKQSLQGFRFFGKSITWLPGLNKIAVGFNDYLALNFMSILMAAGVPDQQCEEKVKDMLKISSAKSRVDLFNDKTGQGLDNALGFAKQLGNLQEEIEQQIILKRESIIEDYTTFKDKISTAALIGVAVIVGTIIIAMYLPIFQMGKIVGG